MNKLSTLFLSALVFGSLLSGCNKERNPVAGANSHKTLEEPAIDVIVEEIPLAGYTDIVNDANLEVVIVEDVSYNVIIEADDYFSLSQVQAEVQGDKLTIDAPPSITSQAIVYVHTPVVQKVRLGKGGNMSITGNYANIEVDMKGSGNLKMTGNAIQMKIKGGGSGEVDALSMPAIDVVVNSKGGSLTKVAAQNTLDVDLSGNSRVFYSGNPVVTSKLKGNSSIKKI